MLYLVITNEKEKFVIDADRTGNDGERIIFWKSIDDVDRVVADIPSQGTYLFSKDNIKKLKDEEFNDITGLTPRSYE